MSQNTQPDPHDFSDVPDPLHGVPTAGDAPSPKRLPPANARPALKKQRLAALAFSLAWILGHLGVYGLRSDLDALPATYVAVQIVAPLVLAFVCLGIALVPGRFGLGVRVTSLLVVLGLAPVSFWLAMAGMSPPRATADAHPWLSGFVCLDITIAWVSVPLLCSAFLVRRAFPAAAAYRSALLGAACGLLAGAAINLHCANVSRFHMFFGHGIPVLIATLVGALLIARSARS